MDLVEDVEVASVRENGVAWVVRASDGREWASATRPLLATGFTGSLGFLDGLIEYDGSGVPAITEEA